MGIRLRNKLSDGAATGDATEYARAPVIHDDDTSTLPRVPGGINALFVEETVGEGENTKTVKRPLRDTDPVLLINLSISQTTVRDIDPAVKTDKGWGERFVKLKPFAHYTMTAYYARRVLAAQNQFGGSVAPIVKLVVAPPVKDCGGRMTFKRTDFHGVDATFETCPWRDCPRHPVPALMGTQGVTLDPKWSVLQMQHFVARCENLDPIDFVIETVDRRPAVVAYAQFMKRLRSDRQADMLGVVPRRPGSRPN